MPINTINQDDKDLNYVRFNWCRLKPFTQLRIIWILRLAEIKYKIRIIWKDGKANPRRLIQWLRFFWYWTWMTQDEKKEWLQYARWTIYKREKNYHENNHND